MINAKKSEAGYTLVEVLVVLTVVAILLGIVTTFSVNALVQTTTQSVQANMQTQSQITMDRIINDVRLSAGADEYNRIEDNNNAGGEFSWQSDADTLVLATAVIDISQNIVFADASKYISEKNNVVYFVRDNTLYKRILASPVANNSVKTTCPANNVSPACPADRALLSDVRSFTIKYLNGNGQVVNPTDARSIELTIDTSTKRFSKTISSSYTTRAVFRND